MPLSFPDTRDNLVGGSTTEGLFQSELGELYDFLKDALVDGGTPITNFKSTGITDSATTKRLIIDDVKAEFDAIDILPKTTNNIDLGGASLQFANIYGVNIFLNGTGLGTMSTQASNNVTITGGSITGITDLPIADGGTGSSTASAARDALGGNAAGARTIESEAAGVPTGGASGDIVYQY